MKTFFDSSDTKFLMKYMGDGLIRRWEGLERKQSHVGVVTIANTGLYSSGKSSLFNALLDQINNERFPVGAIPTTKAGDKERLSEHVEIIDTPGIDATYEDDQVAIDMLMESDIILMTHNIKMGMLNQSEYTWIQNIKNHISHNELEKRLVFVCTWIDEVTDEEDRVKVREELKRQLAEVLGTHIPFWEVSAKRYCVAGNKKIEKLKTASNIPQFRDWLLKKAAEFGNSADEIWKRETLALCMESREVLRKKRSDVSLKYEQIKKEVDRQFAPRKQSWDLILESFKDMRKTVQNNLRNLKKEEYGEYSSFEQRIKSM